MEREIAHYDNELIVFAGKLESMLFLIEESIERLKYEDEAIKQNTIILRSSVEQLLSKIDGLIKQREN